MQLNNFQWYCLLILCFPILENTNCYLYLLHVRHDFLVILNALIKLIYIFFPHDQNLEKSDYFFSFLPQTSQYLSILTSCLLQYISLSHSLSLMSPPIISIAPLLTLSHTLYPSSNYHFSPQCVSPSPSSQTLILSLTPTHVYLPNLSI